MRAAKNLSQTYSGSRETYNPGLLQHSNLPVPFSRLLLPATPAQSLQHSYYYQLLLLLPLLSAATTTPSPLIVPTPLFNFPTPLKYLPPYYYYYPTPLKLSYPYNSYPSKRTYPLLNFLPNPSRLLLPLIVRRLPLLFIFFITYPFFY